MGYSWVQLALKIYTSDLILFFTICVHSATRHNINFIYLLSDWCYMTDVVWQTNLVYHDVWTYYNFRHKHQEQNISMASQPWQKWVEFKISYKVLVINMWDQEITTQEMEIIA